MMNKGRKLIIVGGGGFAREVIWIARACPDEWQVDGILDDADSMRGTLVCNTPVLGKIKDWVEYPDSWFVIAIGSPRIRKKVVSMMESMGKVKFGTLIHPSILMSEYVDIGEGSIITAGCILTTQVKIGRHVIINLLTTIGHDVCIGDFSTLAPQVAVSGNIIVGKGVEIGTGAVLIQGKSIGEGSFVGAGSILTKDIPDNVLVLGSPARKIKSLEAY